MNDQQLKLPLFGDKEAEGTKEKEADERHKINLINRWVGYNKKCHNEFIEQLRLLQEQFRQ